MKKMGVAQHANREGIEPSTVCTANIIRSRNGDAFT